MKYAFKPYVVTLDKRAAKQVTPHLGTNVLQFIARFDDSVAEQRCRQLLASHFCGKFALHDVLQFFLIAARIFYLRVENEQVGIALRELSNAPPSYPFVSSSS